MNKTKAPVETYKGVPIFDNDNGVIYSRYSFDYHPIWCADPARGAGDRWTNGTGEWSAPTIAEARQRVDQLLEQHTLTELPPARPWAPPAGSDAISLSVAAIAAIIRTVEDAQRVAAAVSNPALQVIEGWPLMSWRTASVAGCVAFYRHDDAGAIQSAVVVVNAPESRRSEYAPDGWPCPTTVLMVG